MKALGQVTSNKSKKSNWRIEIKILYYCSLVDEVNNTYPLIVTHTLIIYFHNISTGEWNLCGGFFLSPLNNWQWLHAKNLTGQHYERSPVKPFTANNFSTNCRQLQPSQTSFLLFILLSLSFLLFFWLPFRGFVCFRHITSVFLTLLLPLLWIFPSIFNDVSVWFRDKNLFRMVFGNVVFFRILFFKWQKQDSNHNHLVCKRTLNHLANLSINDRVVLWVLICTVSLTVCCYDVTYEFQSESKLYSLHECQGTPCSKQWPYLKFKWQQQESNQHRLSS